MRKPNKRFSIKKEDLVTRIFRMSRRYETFLLKSMVLILQSLMGIRCYCNVMKARPRKHWHWKGWIPIKTKYMLSRERATVFTQTSSDSSIDLKPEFVFKGKCTRHAIWYQIPVVWKWLLQNWPIKTNYNKPS